MVRLAFGMSSLRLSLRIFLLAVIFQFGATFQSVEAQEPTQQDVQKLAEYVQSASVLYQKILEVTQYYSEVEPLMLSMSNGDISEGEATSSLKLIVQNIRRVAKESEQILDCCVVKPRFENAMLSEVIDNIYSYHASLPNTIVELSAELENTTEAFIDGDYSAYLRAQSKSYDLLSLTLEGEANFLKANLIFIPETIPGYWIQKSYILTNEIIIHMISVISRGFSGSLTASDLQTARSDSNDILKEYEYVLEKGRGNIKNFRRRVENFKGGEEKNFFLEITKNFEDKIIVEEKIFKLLVLMYSVVLRDELLLSNESPKFSEVVESFKLLSGTELQNVLAERMNASVEGMKLGGQMGGM
jgi:hypothetical protein